MKNLTKQVAAALTVLGVFWQSPQGEQGVKWLLLHYPHLVGLVSTISALLLLLHSPTVQKALGLQVEQTTTTTTATVVPLSPQQPGIPAQEK